MNDNNNDKVDNDDKNQWRKSIIEKIVKKEVDEEEKKYMKVVVVEVNAPEKRERVWGEVWHGNNSSSSHTFHSTPHNHLLINFIS